MAVITYVHRLAAVGACAAEGGEVSVPLHAYRLVAVPTMHLQNGEITCMCACSGCSPVPWSQNY